VDQAVDFVLSKINQAVGTRAHGVQAPVAYEMPPEVVREAIVNAVAHRDYTSNGSVQVMLFADRLEVWNPGTLPPSLTLAQLRQPHGSVPGNPLLAEPLYLTKYIERMGTGTGDMIERCRQAGLPEPEFNLTDGFVTTLRRVPERAFVLVGGQAAPPVTPPVAPPVAPPVEVLVRLLGQAGALGNADIRRHLGLKDRAHLRERYLDPALAGGLIEPTIPDKPRSRLQRYRLTAKGADMLAELEKEKPS
jgi:predicted HTH transcriptional regulator